MTIATFTELSTAIVRRLHRTDMDSDIADLITLAEKRIATMLRARLMEASGTIATVAGTVTAALPSTLLGIQSLSINQVAPTIDYISPEQFAQDFPDSTYLGVPRSYTIVGDNVRFGPTPDAVYTVAVVYSGSVTPLTAAAPSNALLTKWPNVYLYGALAESAEITRDMENGQRYESKFQDAINGVNLIDWHAGGLMRVRTDVRS
ncbi:MAG: hypothetical protein V4633_13545 [Pseudomonadota bacterium]